MKDSFSFVSHAAGEIETHVGVSVGSQQLYPENTVGSSSQPLAPLLQPPVVAVSRNQEQTEAI